MERLAGTDGDELPITGTYSSASSNSHSRHTLQGQPTQDDLDRMASTTTNTNVQTSKQTNVSITSNSAIFETPFHKPNANGNIKNVNKSANGILNQNKSDNNQLSSTEEHSDSTNNNNFMGKRGSEILKKF